MNEAYKALSDPTRRKILQLLRRSDMTAGEIGEHFMISAPALSRHFSILKAANLITSEKQANFIAYQLNVSVLEETLLELMSYFDLGKKDDE
ncbi:autorepressor SdpR family transcription factor [Reinekea sp. G2M2-21]|uniref:autorepressor SdpR family transcription factor n=1 Tax=Reinekea sp. G2M2-21 TaxID=2788942 RepID=UPI0018AB2241|nr:autorepressor SdpR family transcription factor [Reinekea sp. G2M2-21]